MTYQSNEVSNISPRHLARCARIDHEGNLSFRHSNDGLAVQDTTHSRNTAALTDDVFQTEIVAQRTVCVDCRLQSHNRLICGNGIGNLFRNTQEILQSA